MLSLVAEITTPTANVQVMEGIWPRPVELTWNDPKPVVTLLLRDATYKAEGCYRNTGRTRSLEPIGSVFFVPPQHELYGWGSGGKVRAARCMFDIDYFRKAAGADGLTDSQLRNTLDIRGTLPRTMLARLMREALSPGFASGVLVESLGTALLVESLGQARAVQTDGEIPEGGLTRRQMRIIDEYREELDNDPTANPPSVTELALRCGLSVRQFSRLFRREHGISVGRFLGAQQMERAQRLLMETSLPLKEIAFRVGFSNAANFSTAFSAAFHVPPAAFRRRHQEH